jgi:hypothetical protein
MRDERTRPGPYRWTTRLVAPVMVLATVAGSLSTIGSAAALSTPSSAHAAFAPAADPTSPFAVNGYDGYAWGGFIWHNRSVGVQGAVQNRTSGDSSTTVYFDFYQGSTYLGMQRRAAGDGARRSYNFTASGPVGGIAAIWG